MLIAILYTSSAADDMIHLFTLFIPSPLLTKDIVRKDILLYNNNPIYCPDTNYNLICLHKTNDYSEPIV